MKIRLEKKWQMKLANLPETSMGSQHVDIILDNGRVLADVTVFNGNECETAQEFDPQRIKDIKLHRRG